MNTIGPTHRCRICGALWTLNPALSPDEHRAKHCSKGDCQLLNESWSLASATCGKCCDNVAMGDQIEAVRS